MSEILYVTSFNRELYEASGKRLLESFRQVALNAVCRMLVCYEGTIPISEVMRAQPLRYPNGHDQTSWYDLGHDDFLNTWLAKNVKRIPDYLGGHARECDCPGREKRHAKHRYACHWQWMNRNASRWFRKVASLHHAASVAETYQRYLVWLDADVVFKRYLPVTWIQEQLLKVGMFHFRGHRPATEAGVLAFDLQNGGQAFIKALCERYTSQRYAMDERWDDGFQIARVAEEGVPGCKCRDLVHPTKWKGKTNNVIPTTPIDEFLTHDKGRHGTGLDIMK